MAPQSTAKATRRRLLVAPQELQNAAAILVVGWLVVDDEVAERAKRISVTEAGACCRWDR